MRRYQVRIDTWIDAPDREAVRHQITKLLDRLVAQGLGCLDFKSKLPLHLSHWRMMRLRHVPLIGEEREPDEGDDNEED